MRRAAEYELSRFAGDLTQSGRRISRQIGLAVDAPAGLSYHPVDPATAVAPRLTVNGIYFLRTRVMDQQVWGNFSASATV